jgi:hypothetical protein
MLFKFSPSTPNESAATQNKNIENLEIFTQSCIFFKLLLC